MAGNAEIQAALINRLRDFAPLPAVDVAYPDENYEPQSGREYIEVQFSISPTQTPYVGNNDPTVYVGFLQLTVVYPRLYGDNNYMFLVDDIIDHFRKGTKMDHGGVRVNVDVQPYASGPFRDDTWNRVPVTISYRCVVY